MHGTAILVPLLSAYCAVPAVVRPELLKGS